MFSGTGIAVITPFKKDYSLDVKSLQSLTDFQIQNGVEYLVLMGTTGESVTLTAEEKDTVLKTVKDVNKGRVPLVVGIGGNNTRVVTDTIKGSDLNGVDGILSVSPYYNKPNQEGIYHHYAAVANASPVPVILYNVPGRTGSNVQAETTLRLANEFDNITTIKEASADFDQCMKIISNKPEAFEVVSGEDALTLPLISAGMSGVISVAANAFPAEFSQMVRDAREGKMDKARNLHYKMLPLMDLFFADGSPGGVKAFLSQQGFCENVVRPPLAPVNKEIYERIKEAGDLLE